MKNNMGSEQLDGQSSSNVTARCVSEYQDIFRMSDCREEGWLKLKIGETGNWEQMYITFDSGVFYYSTEKLHCVDPEKEGNDGVTRVHMDQVISLRTDDQYGDSTIQIATTEHKLYLRAPCKDEMRRWLFCFQRSVALVLSKLLLSSSQSFPDTKLAIAQYNMEHQQQQQSFRMAGGADAQGTGEITPRKFDRISSEKVEKVEKVAVIQEIMRYNSEIGHQNISHQNIYGGDDKQKWTVELGHGHGRHSYLARRRNSSLIEEDVMPPALFATQSSSESIVLSEVDKNERLRNGSYLKYEEGVGVGGSSGYNSSGKSSSNSGMAFSSSSSFNGSQSLTFKVPLLYVPQCDPHTTSHRDSVCTEKERTSVYASNSSLMPDKIQRDRDREGCERILSRSRSIGQSSDAGDDKYGYDYYKYGDVTDDDPSLSGSDGGMMYDFDDQDSTISRSNSNIIGVKRSCQSRNQTVFPPQLAFEIRTRNEVTMSIDNGDATPLRAQKVSDQQQKAQQHLQQLHEQQVQEKEVQEEVQESRNELHWCSGFCSKLGPRTSNEDRLVALPDLVTAALQGAKKSHSSSAAGSIGVDGVVAVFDCADENGTADGNGKSSLLVVGKSVVTVSSASDANNGTAASQVILSEAECQVSKEGKGQGQRREGERHGYFAVYDGHCGAQAATYLQETLHLSIYNHPLYHTDLQTAIIESCVSTDHTFLAESRERNTYSGTTALGAIVRGDELTVFNIGDCHAVLCCAGVPVDMSNPHKPNRPDEAARILSAKGWITEEKELYMARLHRMDLTDPVVRDKAQQVSWVSIHRVCGEISVSRSIGDPDYKTFQPGGKVDAFFIWPEGHDQVFMADLLIPVPECRSIKLCPEHEFLLIASDGLWDVISSAEAVLTARVALAGGKSAEEACEVLCDLALKLGSSDNVTVLIVQFITTLSPSPPLPPLPRSPPPVPTPASVLCSLFGS